MWFSVVVVCIIAAWYFLYIDKPAKSTKSQYKKRLEDFAVLLRDSDPASRHMIVEGMKEALHKFKQFFPTEAAFDSASHDARMAHINLLIEHEKKLFRMDHNAAVGAIFVRMWLMVKMEGFSDLANNAANLINVFVYPD